MFFRRALSVTLFMLFGVQPQAIAQKPEPPLVINIDNPAFRKLVVAVPVFVTANDRGTLGNLAIRGAKEFADLLTFSGMFNVISENAYKELNSKMVAAVRNRGGLADKGRSGKSIDGVDPVQWKALGIESITVAELAEDNDLYSISLKTLDLNKNEMMLGKHYTKVKITDFTTVLRRYADLLLLAYTGKPGIFSTKLTFVGRRTKDSAKQIFVSDFDGSNAVQITTGNYPHLSPAWSHDGRYITFTSYKDKNPDIYIHELATGKQTKIAGKNGMNSGSNWSPDDKVIAFSGSVGGEVDLYLMDGPNGARRRMFIKGTGLDVDPAFSPDGKYLAYVSGRFGNPHIFRADLTWDKPTEPRVTGEKRLTFAGWYNAVPAWAPTSDLIAFAGFDKDINRFDLFTVDPDGKKLERLTLRTGDNESPSWSPNGQLIVFHSNRINGQNIKSVAQLFVMNRDGSSQRQLNTGLYEAQTPKWSRLFE